MSTFANGTAVVVGIADYQHISGLPKIVLEDAKAVRSALTDPRTCGYDPTRVIPLLNEQATKCALRDALLDAAKRCDVDSTFVFYVSSHGGQVEKGDGRGAYLLPVDTVFEDAESLARTSLSGQELTELLNKIPARRLVAIFDCCHSAGIGQPKGSFASLLKQGLPEEFYKQLATGQGRVVFASCRDSEFSYVLPGEPNSVFTKYLLDGLRGKATGPGGVIRVFDLFHYLQPRVVADQPNQHPVFKCEVEENFPLALHSGGKGTPLPTAADAPNDGFKYDVFISYRQQEPDKRWVRNVLLPRLKAEGLRVCIDFESFRLSSYIITEIEKAVEGSRYTVAVLSPAYLQSNFTELENVLAEHLGLETTKRRLLAVMRERCNPRLGMRARLWLDMQVDAEVGANVARLVQELRMAPEK